MRFLTLCVISLSLSIMFSCSKMGGPSLTSTEKAWLASGTIYPAVAVSRDANKKEECRGSWAKLEDVVKTEGQLSANVSLQQVKAEELEFAGAGAYDTPEKCAALSAKLDTQYNGKLQYSTFAVVIDTKTGKRVSLTPVSREPASK